MLYTNACRLLWEVMVYFASDHDSHVVTVPNMTLPDIARTELTSINLSDTYIKQTGTLLKETNVSKRQNWTHWSPTISQQNSSNVSAS